MKKNKIQKDMNLNFNEKVSVQEVENNLGIYFGEIPSDIDVKKYVRQDNSLAINVKWYHPKFNNKLISNKELFEEVSQTIISVFWYKANQIAINYGYTTCLPTGRSDGWAEPLVESKNTNILNPIVYWGKENKTLEYLIQLKIFSMFANDIENLFKLIDKEIQAVTNMKKFVVLQNKIYDL
jgi:hypothetical protein